MTKISQKTLDTVATMKNMATTAILTILDQGYTPHVVFATEGVQGLPNEWSAKPMVPLNFNPVSYDNYSESMDYIMFDTRFSGRPHSLTMNKKSIVEIRAIDPISKEVAYKVIPIQSIGLIDKDIVEELGKYLSDFTDSKNANTDDSEETSESSEVEENVEVQQRPPRAVQGVPHLRRIK